MTESIASMAVSEDGTEIGYWSTGHGQPLVVVHGGTADHTRWQTVLPYFEPHATVHAVDRRGRGASGDGPDYALEREFEDVAAVVDTVAEATGGPVDLVGHSFGALCAVGGVALTSSVRRLVLYEPAGWSPDDAIAPEMIDKLDALLAEGRREDLLVAFFREAVHMPESELALLRDLPAWQSRVAAAHTVVRELWAIESFEYDNTMLAKVAVPTLVLVGSESPAGVRSLCERVADAVPQAELGVLAGEQHVAIDTAPELFAETVLAFIRSDRR